MARIGVGISFIVIEKFPKTRRFGICISKRKILPANALRTSVSSLELGFKFKCEFLLSVLSNRQPWHFLAARSRQKRVVSDARMLKDLAHQPPLLSMKVSFPRATASWRHRKLSMQISSNIQILRRRPQFTFRTILNKTPIKRRRQNLHLQTGLGLYVLVDGDLLRSAHFHIEKIILRSAWTRTSPSGWNRKENI